MESNNKSGMSFTFNFNDKVGQNIAHVEHLEAHFDKDMNMQVIDVEHSSDSDIDDSNEVMSVDERVKRSLEVIIANNVIVNKYDYAMIQMIVEQKLNLHFDNGQSFLNYLSYIGITYKDPKADSINAITKDAKGEYPNWHWVGIDHNEEIRRNNIARQFLCAYNKDGK